MVDLSKITTNGKALFLAYDQGMEHGPSDFDDKNVDPNYILKIGVEGGFNGLILQKGVAEKYYPSANSGQVQNQASIPLIMKLNGKTNLVQNGDPYSPLLCTVDEALSLGAQAVGYTIYVGSDQESKMTSEFAQVVRDAHTKNIPVIGWMYQRGKSLENRDPREVSAYGARLGLELGADIIKMKYPGNYEDLRRMVQSAGKTKLVVSGGTKENDEEFLAMARDVMRSGAIGMAVGRNIWQNKEPLKITSELKKIIFK
ncbi:MAG: fructose-bisphosphate aldolase [Candidatus Levybacteria bacterium]|nr:fructose-bisphosphate aldolase [Candidatus Levybacteria bacterium]